MTRLLAFSCALFSSYTIASGVYIKGGSQQLRFDDVSLTTRGVSLGYIWGEKKAFLFNLDLMKKSELLNYSDISIKYSHPLYSLESLDVFWNAGFGASFIDYELYGNPNTLLSLPLGISATYHFNKKLGVNFSSSYKLYTDLTSPTVCNDGSESQSTGSGTCSHHGGISRYNDKIGNGGGLNVGLGIIYSY